MREEEKWRLDRIGAPEAREIRRGRREELSGKSRRGVEGDCVTHSGSLLSSQAGPLHSKVPSKLRGSWGHRREAGEIRRGRQEWPSQTRRAGEERRGRHLLCSLKPRKPPGLPGEVP